MLGLMAAVILRVKGWIRVVGFDDINTSDDTIANYECHDHIMPLTDDEFNIIRKDPEKILLLGNDPFAAGYYAGDGLADMLEDRTGASVYNCSVSGSYISMKEPAFDMSRNPQNIYSLYYLTCVACMDLDYSPDLNTAKRAMGAEAPVEGPDVLRALSELDMESIDVIVIFYDGNDYLLNAPTGLDETRFSDPYCTYIGGFAAAIDLLKKTAPQARIIVMSAPYMYHVTVDGSKWLPNEDYPNRQGADLSDYVLNQYNLCINAGNVSFVDDYYTGVNIDTGHDLLRDGRYLNDKGREVVLDRLMYALTYFDEDNIGKVEIPK